MAKVIGSVDLRGRPIIRLEVGDDSILLVVDTGFNGDLMLARSAARLLGVDPRIRETDVELGDGRTVQVKEARTTIRWLEHDRRARILVSDDWTVIGDAPAGLVGTELLAPHLLLIDFAGRTVEIESQG